MAYTINKTDGTELTVLQDATVDTTTSITLVGRNYIGYGEIQNENFLFLLENFANDAAPSTPIAGQIWFDTTTRTLKVYDADKWVEVGAAALSETPPSAPPQGAFWLKTPINTLHVYDGNDWKLIGPESVEGFGTTRAVSTSVLADTGTRYPIIQVFVNDVVSGIISSNSFTLSTVNPITGFTDIKAGYNLPTTGFVYQGNLTGVADKAARLETLRLINGVGFDGSKDITIKASTTNELIAGDYISGTNFDGSTGKTWAVDASPNNLIGRVVARDGAGDFAAGTITANLIGDVQGNVTVATGNSTFNTVTANQFIGAQLTGNADTATRFSTPRNINGVSFDGSTDVTVPADANTLTGTNLANNVKTSALTSVGILSSLSVAGSIVLDNNLTIEGNGDAEISSLRKLLITANDGSDDAALQLISPDTAVSNGVGPRGGLTPVTNGDVDLGKSTHKFDNVYANTFNGSLVGNATSSTTSGTANNLAGGSAGSVPYQTTSGATNFVPAGTAGYVLRSTGAGAPTWGALTFATLNVGDYLVGSNYDGVSPTTLNVDATENNTADKVVARDSSGNFSAGTITASLNGNANTATAFETPRTINGVTFDGTGNITITATDPDAVKLGGSTMTGPLTLSGNPSANLHAATKQYVDNVAAAFTVTYGNTVYSTSGYTNQVGSFNNSRNYFDVFPPAGKAMGNLVAFIPSIAVVHYAGGVDGNDSIRCTWQAQSDRIRVWVQNTEQRSTPAANYLAVWS